MPSAKLSSVSNPESKRWQKDLEQKCKDFQIQAPSFQIVSDRRGGRTAWSSVVTVYGTQIEARFWYDGKNLNNAREDAAEAAVKWLKTGLEQVAW